MTINIISIPDCPNHALTVALVKAVIASAEIRADIREVLVTNLADAQDYGFLGSPTVLVDGKDLEGLNAPNGGLSCRVYANGTGIPSEALVRRAVDAAHHAEAR